MRWAIVDFLIRKEKLSSSAGKIRRDVAGTGDPDLRQELAVVDCIQPQAVRGVSFKVVGEPLKEMALWLPLVTPFPIPTAAVSKEPQ